MEISRHVSSLMNRVSYQTGENMGKFSRAGFERMCMAAVIGICSSMPAISADEDNAAKAAFTELLAHERQVYYRENPGTGPVGQPAPVADRMYSVSVDDYERRLAENRAMLARLEAIDRALLSEDDQVNYDMFSYMLNRAILFDRYRTWRMPFVSDSGFHTWPTRRWYGIRFRSAEDYEAYLKSLEDMPNYLENNIVNLKTGVAEGFTMPKIVLDGLLTTFSAIATDSAEDSSFYGPFNEMAAAVSVEDQERLRAQARKIIDEKINPAYRALDDFMRNTYYPAAREGLAASDLPEGPGYYADLVKFYTTVDISPDEVHELGLREVARIRGEMEEIIEELGFEGSFQDFLTFLRTDPQFYAKSERDLLMYASYVAKQIDGKIPALFGHLPRQPYGVEPVPAALAPNYTTGRYSGAPLEAPRGGAYWVNTYALDKRPLYAIPALTLHEAVPGHHLQIALSKELENVPEFRLGLYPHAFGEGWGLYAERLGIEMGIYETPYENFGRLTYEMWRACRLVIDTGIHSKGWTRDQAIKLLAENSALSMHNIRTEVDRYISWPGQALAYKMGELKFRELRARATEELGDKFDVREFHDEVLSLGGVPLYLVEAQVNAWIAEQMKDDMASD